MQNSTIIDWVSGKSRGISLILEYDGFAKVTLCVANRPESFQSMGTESAFLACIREGREIPIFNQRNRILWTSLFPLTTEWKLSNNFSFANWHTYTAQEWQDNEARKIKYFFAQSLVVSKVQLVYSTPPPKPRLFDVECWNNSYLMMVLTERAPHRGFFCSWDYGRSSDSGKKTTTGFFLFSSQVGKCRHWTLLTARRRKKYGCSNSPPLLL